MGRLTDSVDADVECPGCGKSLKVNLGQAMRTKKAHCPSCGEISVKFTGDDLRELDRSFDELEQTIEDLDTTLKL